MNLLRTAFAALCGIPEPLRASVASLRRSY